jgi:hypothetical protein
VAGRGVDAFALVKGTKVAAGVPWWEDDGGEARVAEYKASYVSGPGSIFGFLWLM